MPAYLYRMPSGIPGDVTRYSVSTIEPVPTDSSNPFASFGIPGKIVSGKFVPLASGDTDVKVYGFLVRAYPTQNGVNQALGADTPLAGVMGNVLRRGYIAVKLNAGVAALGAPVYVRVGGATDSQPIGGIEAAADATAGNTIELANCTFMSAADASGNVEIAYNL
ncbi:structural cement protein Gp24 [Frateuria aurantia]|uniref:Bacteriophage protein n=1 Tax=Frateuria aurantia (strain ATCC 33424 / DSM 6220 / KCTC 2777 / LMG 1558 / NBRC 3245 / NCIMB 13370) TaxID=767434 RepID=H8L667_FRAAD|nr:hypothetical protein [Frateuria aurantia]AFC85911.1 hypothetical protein Fraau_1490 [Frateuria aurantia DSM 6220]